MTWIDVQRADYIIKRGLFEECIHLNRCQLSRSHIGGAKNVINGEATGAQIYKDPQYLTVPHAQLVTYR